MKPAMMLIALSLLSSAALAQNEASYDPATGEVMIPKLQVIGDPDGLAYSINMRQTTGAELDFTVTNITSGKTMNVQLGTRPYFLIEDMDASELKTRLQACSEGPFMKTDFSIGHRGAPMQYPEHTRESYVAAARMGAGILECDVTFTQDRQLVCRHAQCDLHTTTNILTTPLAEKCSVPFDPTNPSATRCCASDITLAEFKTLCGKMDAANNNATTLEEYMDATANWRTDLYSSCGTVLSHAESIELFKSLGTKMTPELKSPSVEMPFQGEYTQAQYAQQLIDEYKAAGVDPSDVYAQSFNYSDVQYWIANEPEFGQQAVYLDGRAYGETAEDQSLFANFDPSDASTWAPRDMTMIFNDGVRYIAPPMWVLVTLDDTQQIVPSAYARAAKAAGLNIITWTIERSGLLNTGGGWYYQTITDATNNDGDMMVLLDVLAKEVEIEGIFSDWPATVTYYANCMGL